MAQVEPIDTIENMRGKVRQHSDFSKRIRNGKTYTYYWNPKNPETISPRKVLMQYAMKLANLRAKDELADPDRKNEYAKLLKKDRNYHELRPFVVARFLKEIKAAVLAGDEATIQAIITSISTNERHPDTKAVKINAISTFLP